MLSTVEKVAAPKVARAMTVPDMGQDFDSATNQHASQAIASMLQSLNSLFVPQRRMVHSGDVIYRAGERSTNLFVLNSGFFKIVNLAPDGREQVVGLKFRGDWLGFDGIANGRYGCDAMAMDTGEVWMIGYDELLRGLCAPAGLLNALHEAMSREIAHDRDSLMSVCTLPADARVADFLRYWAESLARRGMRTDQITLRMTRAEIGNYLGMTLETVSRAMSRLARDKIIALPRRGAATSRSRRRRAVGLRAAQPGHRWPPVLVAAA